METECGDDAEAKGTEMDTKQRIQTSTHIEREKNTDRNRGRLRQNT